MPRLTVQTRQFWKWWGNYRPPTIALNGATAGGLGVILKFLSEAKTSLLGFVIIGVITYCGFYVYDLKSDISDLTLTNINTIIVD